MKRAVVAILAVLIVFSQVLPVQALNRSIGLDSLGYEKDVVVKAPQSSLTLTFPVPRLAKIQSASAVISLTPSPQLNGDALFFFHVNDKLVETRTARDLRQAKSVVVNLPQDGDYRDSMRLQVKSNMFITNDVCRDFSTGGLYFSVHKDTRLNLQYDMLPVRSVGDFFGNLQQELLIVVPNEAVLSEMMPADRQSPMHRGGVWFR